MERFEHGGNAWAHPGCVDFSASLNPLGMPTSVRAALREQVDTFSAYPDPACRELTQALAAHEGVDVRHVLVCAGATDALFRVFQAVRPRRVLVPVPSYLGYEQALEQVGAQVVYHALSESCDFALTDEVALALDASVDLLVLANPNNPTGRFLDRTVLSRCLDRAGELGIRVVLDECFVDLVGTGEGPRGSQDLLETHPQLVIVKALTKTYALAGLRLGYALCADEDLLQALRAAGQPWAVSTPAQVAGLACLADDGYLAESRALVARERSSLVAALRSLGLRVVEGEVNYLLFQARAGLDCDLLERGLLIRSCANFVGLDDTWYRIAVRTAPDNARLVEALREVL